MPSITLGRRRAGVTLAELLVVIVILGLVAGIAIQALAPVHGAPDSAARGAIERQLRWARSTALRTRRPVVVHVDDSSAVLAAVALPDGSVIGDAMLVRDRLTGTRRDSAAAHE
jgi:prepilin-type N-terminal cleavage/methylation domain-containing protein